MSRRGRPLPVLLLALAACDRDPSSSGDDDRFEPTDAAVLSAGSPGRDEDPSVLRAQDGSLYVAWFSDRTGTGDIYITRAGRGTVWATPIRVTTDAGGDFNPGLIQDATGTFHLTWFRWTAPFRGHIRHNASADGVTWDPGREVRVTEGADVDDWVPTIAEAADGSLLIWYASAKRTANGITDLHVARRPPGSTGWTDLGPAAGLNAADLHDHLPFAARMGDSIGIAWVRHDTTEPLPWLNRKSDVWYASSANGLAWSAPVRVTGDAGPIVNLFPAFFADDAGRWSLSWLSTRTGRPEPFAVRVSQAASYPAGQTRIDGPGSGYSHRMTWTGSRDVYLGVWVSGPDGQQDIGYRFFRR